MEIKNFKKIWLVSIFVLLVLFAMYLIYINKNHDTVNKDDTVKYEIVKNYNDFYTVNSCVYRYLSYLQASNKDALLKILDNDFVNKYSINKDNVFEYLNLYDGNLNFSSKKMYEEKLSSNVYKYYVYGYVEKDVMDSFPEKNDAYFIVKLDKKNTIFSIEPYDGAIFR